MVEQTSKVTFETELSDNNNKKTLGFTNSDIPFSPFSFQNSHNYNNSYPYLPYENTVNYQLPYMQKQENVLFSMNYNDQFNRNLQPNYNIDYFKKHSLAKESNNANNCVTKKVKDKDQGKQFII